MQTSPVEVATLPAPPLADTEARLGDVSFDEWFDTPVFESDTDERLEELAMSRRGPLRLAASTLLRVNARTERARTRRSSPKRLDRDLFDSALWPDHHEEPRPEDRAPADAGLVHADDPSLDLPPDVGPEAVDEETVDEEEAASGWDDFVGQRPAVPAGLPGPAPAPAPARRNRPGVRGRVSSALDRWAESEVQAQQRLERLLLPRRWQLR